LMTDFISQCFIKDPDSRPTASQLLNHPIFLKENLTKPSYKELKNTLKIMHKKPRKTHASVFEWAPVFTQTTMPDTQAPTQEDYMKSLEEEVRQMKTISDKREEVIKRLGRENEEMKQRLNTQSNHPEKYKDPEAFYRDYFITLSMSVKLNMNARGKECRIDIKELLDLAKDEKVALHELIEWIPKQIHNLLKRKPKSSSKLIKQQ